MAEQLKVGDTVYRLGDLSFTPCPARRCRVG
jgi:hypothetical protein